MSDDQAPVVQSPRVGRAAGNKPARQAAPKPKSAASGGIAQARTAPAPAPQVQAPRAEDRAREALAAAPAAEEPRLTRRSRLAPGGLDNWAEIPEHLKTPGWDYEWKTTRVNQQDVDGAEQSNNWSQGWRPVEAKGRWLEMCPPGYTGKTIERYGQICMTRPQYLTDEARTEDYKIAEQQKYDKLMSASAVPIARPGLMVPTKPEINIEGVVGSAKEKSAA